MALPRLITPAHGVRADEIELDLREWFETPLGQAVVKAQVEILNHVLPYQFGYHLFYSGLSDPELVLQDSPIRHQFAVTQRPQAESNLPQLVCSNSELPLESDSIDVAILHHTLDCDRHPHRVLREMSRVLIPGGSLIIIGFNPWSIWGGWKTVAKSVSSSPLWKARFISPYRINDWLSLLEFDVSGCESSYYLPPLQSFASSTLRGRIHWSWFQSMGDLLWHQGGAAYVLVAKKSVSCMTPIKPKWSRQRQPIVALPAASRTVSKQEKH